MRLIDKLATRGSLRPCQLTPEERMEAKLLVEQGIACVKYLGHPPFRVRVYALTPAGEELADPCGNMTIDELNKRRKLLQRQLDQVNRYLEDKTQ